MATRIAQIADSGIHLIRFMTALLQETYQLKIRAYLSLCATLRIAPQNIDLVVETAENASWQVDRSISRRSRLYDANSEVSDSSCNLRTERPLHPRLKKPRLEDG